MALPPKNRNEGMQRRVPTDKGLAYRMRLTFIFALPQEEPHKRGLPLLPASMKVTCLCL
jgi:hypothetical protein